MTALDGQSLTVRSLRAFKWSGMGELLSRAVAPITLIVLSRLIVPAEYGYFVGATLVVTFCQVFVESSFSRALVRLQEDPLESASSVFWALLGVACALSLLIASVSGPLASILLGDSSAGKYLAALSLQLPIGASVTTHRALLERSLNFKPLFFGRLGIAFGGAVISISAALLGAGTWALVIGALTGAAIEAVVVWSHSPFRPRFEIDVARLRLLSRFSLWFLGQDLLAWLVLYADSLLVVTFLDAAQLGTYRLAAVLVAGAFGVVFVPTERVLFSFFAKLSGRAEIGASMWHLLVVGSFIALPMGISAVVLHREVESLLFSPEWAGIGAILAWFSAREAIANLPYAVDPAYRGMGRPDIGFKVRVVSLSILMIAQTIGLMYGLYEFLFARLVATMLALVVILAVARSVFGPPTAAVLGRYAVGYQGLTLFVLGAGVLMLVDLDAAWRILAALSLLCTYWLFALTRVRTMFPVSFGS